MLAVIGIMQLAVGSRNIGRRRQGDPQGAGWRSNVSLPGRDQTALMGGG
jgi:iron(III) transport system permease protein